MQKNILITGMVLPLVSVVLAVSCVSGEEPANGDKNPQPVIDENPYQQAETLSKRATLYKIARMEAELGTFTVLYEDIENLDISKNAKLLNEMWWTIPWDTQRLAPLPSTQIPVLERDVFPRMGSRLDEVDEENMYVLYTISFDPDDIKWIVANAHTEWPPEEVVVYMEQQTFDCVQVWCIKIAGEWKILAQMECHSEVNPPPLPVLPIPSPGEGNVENDNDSGHEEGE